MERLDSILAEWFTWMVQHLATLAVIILILIVLLWAVNWLRTRTRTP